MFFFVYILRPELFLLRFLVSKKYIPFDKVVTIRVKEIITFDVVKSCYYSSKYYILRLKL